MIKFTKEKDDGNIEYKLKLKSLTDEIPLYRERCISQMLYRLHEGDSRCIYRIGVSDDGELIGLDEEEAKISMQTIHTISEDCHANIESIDENLLSNGRKIFSVNIAFVTAIHDTPLIFQPKTISLRIACIGNVDGGKSTTIGHLASNKNDDGNGSCRGIIMKHPHEISSGRTSYCNTTLIGFDENGDRVFPEIYKNNSATWKHIYENSVKTISLYDTPGHEIYFGNTIRWFSGYKPNYALLCVSSLDGIIGMTKNHIILSYMNNVPLICCITKIDICPADIYTQCINQIQNVVKMKPLSMKCLLISSEEDIETYVQSLKTNSHMYLPIVSISNKTNSGINLLNNLLYRLPNISTNLHQTTDNVVYSINEVFRKVPGVGVVLYGVLLDGTLDKTRPLFVGPDVYGKFQEITVKDIQYKRTHVDSVKIGQECTLALGKIKNAVNIHSGTYLLSNPVSWTKFRAKLQLIGNWSTTFKVGSCPVANIGNVRQSVIILEIMNDTHIMRCNNNVEVILKTSYSPFFARVDDTVILTEGQLRALGTITELFN